MTDDSLLVPEFSRVPFFEPGRNLQVWHDFPTMNDWRAHDGKTCHEAESVNSVQYSLKSGVICVGDGLDTFENGDRRE